MGWKYCVTNCNRNYDSFNMLKVFRSSKRFWGKRTYSEFIMQVTKPRHRLTKYPTWKDGYNRQLFTIFAKLRSWQERSSFTWTCRIIGGHICLIETLLKDSLVWALNIMFCHNQLKIISDKTFSYPVFPLVTIMTSTVKTVAQSLLVR